MGTDVTLLRLLQLVSPALPIGMYSYSQGMEKAIADGWLANSEDVKEWLSGMMNNGMLNIDLPLLARMYDAWQDLNLNTVTGWSQTLLAYRESAELRLEDRQCGQALARLLFSLGHEEMQSWVRGEVTTLANIFAYSVVKWQIPKQQALLGYCWSWLENQILCAVKLIPLGQVSGQRLLNELADDIPRLTEIALTITDDELGGSAFSVALASSRHEMQYSRLFRS